MPCNDLYKAEERFVLFAGAFARTIPKGIALMKLK